MKSVRLPIVLLLVILLPACVTRTTRTVPAGQSIAVTETFVADTVDMGTLRTGERLSKTISLRNDTDRPVAFISTDTSCGCLQLTFQTEPVMPSASVTATLSFDSTGYRYWLPHTVRLYTSLSEKPLKIVVTATIK